MSRILFVNHDADLRAAVSRVLLRAGWDVAVAAHAGHATLACVKGRGFDLLVVVEGETPDAGGEALALRLRRYCPELRVLQMHARPFTADDLLEAVLRAACAIATV